MKKTLFSLLIVLICFFALTACEEIPVEPEHQHSWGDWKIEKEADCQSAGELVRHCFECDEEETSAISKLPHKEITVVGKASSCTEAGYTESVSCSQCGEVITPPEEIEKLSHIESDWITEREATCAREGREIKECTVCKELVEEKSIEKEKHTESGWRFEKVATCNQSGLKYKFCTACNQRFESEIIPMLEHDFKESISYKAPTYHEFGIKAHLKCTRCTAISLNGTDECTVNDLYIPMLDYINKGTECPGAGAEHTMTNAPIAFVKTVAPKCEEWGYDVYECITCEAPVLANWSKPSHKYDLAAPVAKTDPGCDTYGFWFYGCSVCGEPIDSDEGNFPIPNDAPAGSEWVSGGVLRLPMLEHKWDETKTNVTTPPTDNTPGKAVKFCTYCSDYFNVDLPALKGPVGTWFPID